MHVSHRIVGQRSDRETVSKEMIHIECLRLDTTLIVSFLSCLVCLSVSVQSAGSAYPNILD